MAPSIDMNAVMGTNSISVMSIGITIGFTIALAVFTPSISIRSLAGIRSDLTMEEN
jgi:hypothetical protein